MDYNYIVRKITNYLHMQQGWIPKTLYWHKRVLAVWFHLYEIQEQNSSMVTEAGAVVTSLGGLLIGKVQRNFLGRWKCLCLDLSGVCTDVYMCKNFWAEHLLFEHVTLWKLGLSLKNFKGETMKKLRNTSKWKKQDAQCHCA